MDLNYSVEEAAFRDEVREWLRANVPEDLRHKVASYEDLTREDLLRWHRILADKGWVAPEWPVEWGGTGWNVVKRYIFEDRHDRRHGHQRETQQRFDHIHCSVNGGSD